MNHKRSGDDLVGVHPRIGSIPAHCSAFSVDKYEFAVPVELFGKKIFQNRAHGSVRIHRVYLRHGNTQRVGEAGTRGKEKQRQKSGQTC